MVFSCIGHCECTGILNIYNLYTVNVNINILVCILSLELNLRESVAEVKWSSS